MRKIQSHFKLALGELTPFAHKLLIGGLRLTFGILVLALFMFWANRQFFESRFAISRTAFFLARSAITVMIEVFVVSLIADYLEKKNQA